MKHGRARRLPPWQTPKALTTPVQRGLLERRTPANPNALPGVREVPSAIRRRYHRPMVETRVYVRLLILGGDGEPVRSRGLRRELLETLLTELAGTYGVMAEAPDTLQDSLVRVVGPDHVFLTVTVPIAGPGEAVAGCWELVWSAAAACGVRVRDVDVTHDAGSFLRAT